MFKTRMIRPQRPHNTMQQAGSELVEVIMEERPSTVKEDVIRLVEAQISGAVDLTPEEMVDAAFIMIEKINDRIYGEGK